MFIAFVAFVVAAAPATLTYASTSSPPTVASTTLTRIAIGDRQCVAVDGANLRAKADVKSAAVATLELGAPATIRSVGPALVLTGRVDRWLEVDVDGHHGFVFGNVLSAVCGRLDFDGDGDDEIWAASFTSDFQVRVRVRDPAQKDPTKHTASADIDLSSSSSSSPSSSSSKAALRGGTVKAIPVPSPDKRALLGLDICAGSTCRTAVVAWAIDPTAAGRGAAAVLLSGDGAARLPKRAGTTVKVGSQTANLGAWPWVTCPHCGPQPVPVRAIEPAPLFDGALELEPDGPSDSASCTRVAVVREGRHGGADVLDCFVSRFGKGAPGEEEPTPRLFFVRVGKQLLPAGSQDASAVDVADFTTIARMQGYAVGSEAVGLRGIGVGAPRTDLSTSSIFTKDTDGVVLFAHRDLGPVVELKTGPLLTTTPSGRALWRFDVKDIPAGYTISHNEGCGGGNDAVVLVDADLDATRTKLSPAGLQRRLEALRLADNDFVEPTPTTAAIFAKQPPLVVADSFGRKIEAVPLAYRRGCLAEPIVYAYAPTPTVLTIDVAIPTFTTSPPLPRDGWRVRTRSDGQLDLLAGDDVVSRVPRLFWEASTPRFAAPVAGYVVDRVDLTARLRDLGAQLGLTPREAGELADAWDRRIAVDVVAVFVGVHDRALLEQLAPLTITPTPDVVHRVLLDLRPLTGDEATTLRATTSPPPLPTPPARHGVVVVEWGAQLRD